MIEKAKKVRENSEMGDRLAAVRADKGLTQIEFAEALGISQASYNTYENGSREMRSRTLLALRTGFGVNMVWMLVGKGPRYERDQYSDYIATLKDVTAFYEERQADYDDERVKKSVRFLLDQKHQHGEISNKFVVAYLESTL